MFRTIIFLCSLTLLFSCDSNSEYVKSIQDFRIMKDESFKKGENSPLPKKEKMAFTGLQYFEVDPSYKVAATFKEQSLPQYINLYGEQDVKQVHQVKGTLTFDIQGKQHALLAYSTIGQAQHTLFVPFLDKTNGKSTYAGGKYVEAIKQKDGSYSIDFNLSYQPFCVYNENYKCAICPRENFVNGEVLAGEKLSTLH